MADWKHTRVLVVEDEYLVANEICTLLSDIGVTIIGPASDTDAARELLRDGGADVALLDVNLAGRMVYPFAEDLQRREIPYVFVTGYDDWAIDPGYHSRQCLRKPFKREALEDALTRALAS